MFRKLINSMFPVGRGPMVTEPVDEDDPYPPTEEEWKKETLWEWVEYVENGNDSAFTPTLFCLRPFKYQTMLMP